MEYQMGRIGVVARISAVEDDGHLIYLEFRDGRSATVDCTEPTEFDIGDVMRVFDDEPRIEPAPRTLWPDEKWLGVVRRKSSVETLIEANLKLFLVPTTDVSYDVNNTVEGTSGQGVTRVIAQDPIRYSDHWSLDTIDGGKYRRTPGSGTETRANFGGMDEIWERAQRLIVTPLERSRELAALGAESLPRGVLFTGPPGTGKTMLGRILANTVKANFYEISGPEIFSKWYGRSGEVLREIFDDAKLQDRSIIFIDEIDSVVPNREGDTHEETQRVVGQMLALMDGFSTTTNVTVIGTTNRADAIDPALRRPGRFDAEIIFGYPPEHDRGAVLRAQAAQYTKHSDLPFEWMSQNSEGWTPAELSSIYLEACLIAADEHRTVLTAGDCREAFARVSELRTSRGTVLSIGAKL